ncbi:UDP-N-acetylmuramoyl-tripeptide--D-alanyl-D-alanine ligase [Pseudonocardia sp.]|uniref:UDP-N-acetylmuramoyl-tripeptide--D-alanyl-D- alanine ligase n=1 Tax=Pseudonocardia sp. TaxID=60912 RepID=UPI003D133C21
MIEMRLAEVAAVTGGRLHRATGDERVAAVAFDSRAVGPGGLFAALPGERVDGHDFAAAAAAQGAVVLAGRDVDAPAVVVPPAPPGSLAAGSYLAASDRDGSGAAVLAALAALARATVERVAGLAVVGITGSSGKTSTKDLLAAVLAPLGPTVAPAGSFNNELGLPMTALRVDAGTRHLVLEMSSRGPGHIAALCAVAPPRIGVVLNVGSAHVGEFGSREAIAAAKGELVEALPDADQGGVAVLNADDPLVAAMASRTAARVVTVGRVAAADVRASDVRLERGRARFRLVAPAGEADVALQLVGPHHVGNALAVAAVALELGATPEGVAGSLSAASPVSRWRMEVAERADGVTVVNDAYNANPESMRAALEALVGLAGPRRTWAVLGRMAELGALAPAAHAAVADAARELRVAHVLAVGAPEYGARTVPDAAAAAEVLAAELRPGDVVLVKASRAAGLERVAEALLAGGATR